MASIIDAAPPGWIREAEDVNGIPLWRWHREPCYVATGDMDQLRFVGAALDRFEHFSVDEFRAFIHSSPS